VSRAERLGLSDDEQVVSARRELLHLQLRAQFFGAVHQYRRDDAMDVIRTASNQGFADEIRKWISETQGLFVMDDIQSGAKRASDFFRPKPRRSRADAQVERSGLGFERFPKFRAPEKFVRKVLFRNVKEEKQMEWTNAAIPISLLNIAITEYSKNNTPTKKMTLEIMQVTLFSHFLSIIFGLGWIILFLYFFSASFFTRVDFTFRFLIV
jgi:hypothetical protein